MADESPITAKQIEDFFYTKKAVPGSPGQNPDADSVFELGYIPTSKAADFNAITTGYFTINDIGSEALAQLGLNSFLPQGEIKQQADGTFWQIIVTHLHETHEEAYALHNTVSDNIVVFSTGAKPIIVNIRGYVLISDSDDHNYLLLRNYVDHFRARHLSAKGISLSFRSQDTNFKLIIESINLSHTVELETYVGITFSGLAYDYGQTDSHERLDLSYYGKYRKVSASKSEEIEEQEKEKEKETEKETKPQAPYLNTSSDHDFVGPKPWGKRHAG